MSENDNRLKTALEQLRELEEQMHNVPVASVQEKLREVIELIEEFEQAEGLNGKARLRLLAVLGLILDKLPAIHSAIKSFLDD